MQPALSDYIHNIMTVSEVESVAACHSMLDICTVMLKLSIRYARNLTAKYKTSRGCNTNSKVSKKSN